jgi:hypothetical protein
LVDDSGVVGAHCLVQLQLGVLQVRLQTALGEHVVQSSQHLGTLATGRAWGRPRVHTHTHTHTDTHTSNTCTTQTEHTHIQHTSHQSFPPIGVQGSVQVRTRNIRPRSVSLTCSPGALLQQLSDVRGLQRPDGLVGVHVVQRRADADAVNASVHGVRHLFHTAPWTAVSARVSPSECLQ